MKLDIDYIVSEVFSRLKDIQVQTDSETNSNNEIEFDTILVEASGRHVHLSKEHVEILFGKGYELTKKRELSQPGQYLCEEKVTLIGPKGVIQNISVLGPTRKETQVEISNTDAISVGIKAPVKMSGDLSGSAPCVLTTPNNSVKLEKGVIIAKRHIHMTPEDAKKYNLSNNEEVYVQISGERETIFAGVIVRVDKNFRTVLHLDYDEANSCGYFTGMKAKIKSSLSNIQNSKPQEIVPCNMISDNIICKEDFLPKINKEYLNDNNQNSNSKLENTEVFHKKVITEIDIKNILLKGVYVINIMKNSIITPLAMDCIKTNKITLNII